MYRKKGHGWDPDVPPMVDIAAEYITNRRLWLYLFLFGLFELREFYKMWREKQQGIMELQIITNSMKIEESKGVDLMSLVSSIDAEDEDSELVLNSESSEQVRLALESYITER